MIALDTEVLVVGAGPVGLTLAAVLTKLGVSVIVVEKRAGPLPQPRAVSLDDVSARILSRAGLGAQIVDLLRPGTGTTYHGMDGQLLFHARGPSGRPNGFAFKNGITQPQIEQALIDYLCGDGRCKLLFNSAWISATPASREGIVSEILQTNGAQLRIYARYLIASDGAHSDVRSFFGIRFAGHYFPQTWLALDVANDPHHQDSAMHHGDPARPHVIVPYGDHQCRYEFRLFPGEAEPGKSVPFDLVARLLKPFRSIKEGDLIRSAAYQFGALTAARWRLGPLILAGDAAHVMPPFAGAGLNCGLLDADNLAWRLKAVLRQDIDNALLDQYEYERRSHVEAMTRLSVWLGRIMMTTTPLLARYRDVIVRSALHSQRVRRYLEEARFRPQPRVWCHSMRHADCCGWLIPNLAVIRDGRVLTIDEALDDWFGVIGSVKSLARMVKQLESNHQKLPGLVLLQLPNDIVQKPLLERNGGCPLEIAQELERQLKGRLLLVRPDGMIAACFHPHETAVILKGFKASMGLFKHEIPALIAKGENDGNFARR